MYPLGLAWPRMSLDTSSAEAVDPVAEPAGPELAERVHPVSRPSRTAQNAQPAR